MRVWLMAFALLVVPATAMAGGAAPADGQQLPKPRVFELPVQTRDGYTATMTVNVFDRRVADALQRYLDQKKSEYGFDPCAFCDDGSGAGVWSDAAIYDSVTRFIAIACGTVSGVAQALGYMNIYVDAANALCASFTIVTEVESIGKQIYAAYERQTAPKDTSSAAIWVSLIGSCGFGPVC